MYFKVWEDKVVLHFFSFTLFSEIWPFYYFLPIKVDFVTMRQIMILYLVGSKIFIFLDSLFLITWIHPPMKDCWCFQLFSVLKKLKVLKLVQEPKLQNMISYNEKIQKMRFVFQKLSELRLFSLVNPRRNLNFFKF